MAHIPPDVDLDRFFPDDSGQFGWYTIRQWGSVHFLAIVDFEKPKHPEGLPALSSVPEHDTVLVDAEGHRWSGDMVDLGAVPAVFGFETTDGSLEPWPADVILSNWAWRLNALFWRINQAKEAKPGELGCHADQLRAWIDRTRALATDSIRVLGNGFPEVMFAAAEATERALAWPALRFVDPPCDPRGLANLYFSANLWAFDQLLKAVKEATGVNVQRAKALTNLLAPIFDVLHSSGVDVQPDSGAAWTQRIRRIDETIRPMERDNLVADVLLMLRDGPLDQAGEQVAGYANAPNTPSA